MVRLRLQEPRTQKGPHGSPSSILRRSDLFVNLGYYQVFYIGPLFWVRLSFHSDCGLGSALAAFTSAFPAVALLFGFILVRVGTTDGTRELIQGGWGFITVGIIVEFVLPISRRLR